MLLLGAIGWGLFAVGAITHLFDLDRLRELLTVHVRQPRPLALLLVGGEALIALGLLVGLVLANRFVLVIFGIAAGLVGVAFTAWVGRLLATGSDLPCACSFSAAPTSWWSLLRAAGVITSVALVGATADGGAELVAALVTGAAVAVALYVLPDALAWPQFGRDMMERIEAHANSTGFVGSDAGAAEGGQS